MAVDIRPGVISGPQGPAGPAGADGVANPEGLRPAGRLHVPACHIMTASDQAVALTSANHGAAFRVIPEVDYALTSFSVYVTAVATTGTMTVSLRGDTAGSPGTEISALGPLSDGGVADTWIRKIFDAVQLSRNTTYWLVFMGEADKNFSLSARRVCPANGSMPSPGGMAKSTTDGVTWAEITQDSLPAFLNVVLNSTSHHVPQLVYGRWNGASVPLYTDSAWSLATIPAAGIVLDCEALSSPDSVYGYRVFLRDVTGTPTLSAEKVALVQQGGVFVKSGDTSRRYLGLIYPTERLSGYYAPICVPDEALVWNAENQVEKTLGKNCPYSAQTSGAGSGYGWGFWLTPDFRIRGIVGAPTPIQLCVYGAATITAGAIGQSIAFADSGGSAVPISRTFGQVYPGAATVYAHLSGEISEVRGEGLFSIEPIVKSDAAVYALHSTYSRAGIIGSVAA